VEELRWAWAGVLLGWWAPGDTWPYTASDLDELQPNMPDVAARALVAGLDTPALRELAGAPAEDTAGARELLTQVMVELGFEAPPPDASPWQRVRQLLEPACVNTVERLLSIVQRDVDATHPEVGRLQPVLMGSGLAFIGLPDGTYSSHGGPDWACTSPDPDRNATLAAMADSVQDCLVEVLWLQWPACPVHDRMLTTAGDDDQPDWVCARDGGHFVARVGELSRTAPRPHPAEASPA
jgi:hypothetical protein